jgi:hypothetical protein
MTSSEAFPATKDSAASGGRHVFPRVTSLTSLVGAHPDALRALYGVGRPTDPAELGDAPCGRLLTVGEGTGLFLLKRPFLRILDSSVLPWEGKFFDHGGNSGKNVFFGKPVFRFRAEVGASVIDGKPALILSFSDVSYKNPWPVRALGEELRTIGNGIAVGPGVFHGGSGAQKILFWFGLESR